MLKAERAWTLVLGNTDWREPFRSVGDLKWAPDGSLLAVSGVIVDEDVLLAPTDSWAATWLVTPDGEHVGSVEAAQGLAWAPDSKRLASAARLQVWKLPARRRKGRLKPKGLFGEERLEGGGIRVAWSPDGAWLATDGPYAAKGLRPVVLWEPGSGERHELPSPSRKEWLSLAFSGDGRLAALSADGALSIWDVKRRERLLREARVLGKAFERGLSPMTSVCWTPDSGTLVVVAHWSEGVGIVDPATGKLRRLLQGHGDGVECAALAADGRHLATGAFDKTVRVWDLERGGELLRLGVDDVNRAEKLAWSPDAGVLAAACWEAAGRYDYTVRAFRLTGQQRRYPRTKPPADPPGVRWLEPTPGQPVRTYNVAVAPDGSAVMSSHDDGQLCCWQGNGTRWRARPVGDRGGIAVAISPSGRLVAGGASDLELRRLSSGNRVRILRAPGAKFIPYQLRWSPDGAMLAVTYFAPHSQVTPLSLFSVSPPRSEALWTRTLHPDSRSIAWTTNTRDEPVLLTVSFGGTAHLWSPGTGKRLSTLRLVGGSGVATHQPERLLAAMDSYSLEVRRRGRRVWKREVPYSSGCHMAFSPDGRWLASSEGERAVVIRDVCSGETVSRVEDHDNCVQDLCWCMDSSRLVTSCEDQRVRVFDARRGELLFALTYPGGLPGAIARAEGSDLLAVAGGSGAFPVWDLPQ